MAAQLRATSTAAEMIAIVLGQNRTFIFLSFLFRLFCFFSVLQASVRPSGFSTTSAVSWRSRRYRMSKTTAGSQSAARSRSSLSSSPQLLNGCAARSTVYGSAKFLISVYSHLLGILSFMYGVLRSLSHRGRRAFCSGQGATPLWMRSGRGGPTSGARCGQRRFQPSSPSRG
jgi:hypothetical protein